MGSNRPLVATLLLLTLLVVSLALTVPRPVFACEPYLRCGSEFYYYSDPAYTILVGYKAWDCQCRYSTWGTTQGYVQWYPNPCCG
jgi:hypothetical protein